MEVEKVRCTTKVIYLAAQKNFDQEVSRAKRAFHNAQHDKLVKSLKQNLGG